MLVAGDAVVLGVVVLVVVGVAAASEVDGGTIVALTDTSSGAGDGHASSDRKECDD